MTKDKQHEFTIKMYAASSSLLDASSQLYKLLALLRHDKEAYIALKALADGVHIVASDTSKFARTAHKMIK